jgi:uncharacterized membrane protein YphA (DoxX/SURF4 family)
MDEMKLRNQKIDVKGRSILLNVLLLLLNVTGVFLVAKGYHESTQNFIIGLKITGIFLIVASIIGMVMLKGMYLFSYVARTLVGGLFIVSGLVKANDPWGFAFKLEEYFSPTGLTADFPFFAWFEPYVLELSVIICIAEIVLGAALILGGKIKLASWALLLMMVFFTWLTYYTASCNANLAAAQKAGEDFTRECVLDCGCFGDALRGSVGRSLTPLESFWKDLILFYFAFIIFVNRRKIQMNTVKENWVLVPASLIVICFFCWVFSWWFPLFFGITALLGSFVLGNINIGKIAKPWKMAMYVGMLALLFSMYTSFYLPWKDYRPYAIGNNITEQMQNGIDPEIDMVMMYKQLETGEEVSVPLDEYTDNWQKYSDTLKYQFIDRKDVVISEGKIPSISDFRPGVSFENLSEIDKKLPYIDSLIQADYETYYQEYMAIKSIYGSDTIWSIDYDTLSYPDSLYTASEPFVALSDPNLSWEINMTPFVESADFVFLMCIRDVEAMNESSMADFKIVLDGAIEKKIPFFVLTPATSDQIAALKSKFDFASATFLAIDGTEVKIIVRSNPGLLLLSKGTILDKWPSRSIPNFDSIFGDYIEGNE